MSNLSALSPHRLWHWFEVICSIPHGSYHEEALATHIVAWATDKGLIVFRDDVGNIFIKKSATDGMDDREPIALQAHLDMVCQSNDDYDFVNLPIIPVIDGEWVRASGTTLGADNGIGLASILAVLDSDNLAHPTIEAVLTMTEETGMDGAFGLKSDVLDACLMINTDTEEIGEIYLGCAGGVDAEIELPVEVEQTDTHAIRLDLKGLKGGHSGIDIHKNHANAIKLLGYVLGNLDNIQLVDIKGGTARNAIPRAAYAIFTTTDKATTLAKIDTLCGNLKTLIGDFETAFDWQINNATTQTRLSNASTQAIINLINALPNGVYRNSNKVADTVETSSSLGVISLDNTKVVMTSLVRSLSEIGKDTACTALRGAVALSGGTVAFVGSYIGWEPNPNSPITALTADIYRKVIHDEPALKVIHAGLECGLIQQAYPAMDIVSIGPTIKNAHSPDECVHIGSVETYWQVLTGILANSPKKS